MLNEEVQPGQPGHINAHNVIHRLINQLDPTGVAQDFIPIADGEGNLVWGVNAGSTAHNTATTNVHGIADTSALETKTGAQTKATAAENAANAYTDDEIAAHSADDDPHEDRAYTDAQLAAHVADTNVHGIPDTNELLSTSSELSDLSDVSNTSPVEGMGLMWDGEQWTPSHAAGGGVTDHGALDGLDGDDHPQYALADGSRGDFAPSTHGNESHSTDFATQSAFSTHTSATDAHSATASPTASRIILRDAEGRAKVASPAVDADIATKGYADAVGGTAAANAVNAHSAITDAHGATSAATANRIALRDAAGRSRFADPAHDSDAATKGYVDNKVTTEVDALADDLDGAVDEKVNKSGDTMTGELVLHSYRERETSSNTATMTVDFAGAQIQTSTRSGALTIEFTNTPPQNEVRSVTLILGANVTSIVWPPGTTYPTSVPPVTSEVQGEVWLVAVARGSNVTVGMSWANVGNTVPEQ